MEEIPSEAFELVPDISIDHALMEKSQNVVVLPADIGWSDVGSWDVISGLVEPDANNNRAFGDAIFVGSRNTFVQSEDRVVAVVGLENLMIIDTIDALLVVNANATQDVKVAVNKLKALNHDAVKLHRTVIRPWGAYCILEDGPGFKVKRIEVKPGASLSLQVHQYRSEHWVVVDGLAEILNGDQTIQIATNESTYIPAGRRHRLKNIGKELLVIIEVQSGSYLGEDDIVRFSDIYGRS
jgi:mannose-1-phosphate guanylyltransferase